MSDEWGIFSIGFIFGMALAAPVFYSIGLAAI
ncbi:MAG: hypothetical protein ACI81C_004102 [Alteromonas macleodii]|jgi:hypothetical protein